MSPISSLIKSTNSIWCTAFAIIVVAMIYCSPSAYADQKVIDGDAFFQSALKKKASVIEVPAGVLRITKPVRVVDRTKLTIRGAGRGVTLISGSRQYQTRRLRAGEVVPKGISGGSVLVIDVDREISALWYAGGLKGLGCTTRGSFAIYEDGRRLQCARWPNNGFQTGSQLLEADPKSLEIPAPENKIADWAMGQLSVAGYFAFDWWFEEAPAIFDRSTRSLKLSPLKQSYVGKPGYRYEVRGSPADLDSPGEYILDAASSRIFLIPYADTSSLPSVEIPIIRGPVMSVSRSTDVFIENLDVGYGLDDGVAFDSSSDSRVLNVAVKHVNETGISVRGGVSVTVSRALVLDTGSTGVAMTGGDRVGLVPAQHSLDQSVVGQSSKLKRTYSPAVSVNGVGNSVTDSLIFDTPHIGIAFTGNDHLIEGNEIEDVVNETGDAGALYAGRNWTWRGTKIQSNFIHDIMPKKVGQRWLDVRGVYLDDMMSGTDVSDNVFARVGRPVFLGGGRDNTVVGNLFIDSAGPAISLDDRGLSETFAPNIDRMVKGLREVPYSGELYAKKYPKLSNILNDWRGAPMGNVFKKNVVIGDQSFEFRGVAEGLVTLSDNIEVPAPPDQLEKIANGLTSGYRLQLNKVSQFRGYRWNDTLERMRKNREEWNSIPLE